MKRIFAVILAVFAIYFVIAFEDLGSSRQEKYLQFFKVVKIPNFVCGNSTGGVCVTNKDCGKIGGKKVGNCAQGYGICCLVVYNCTNSPEMVTVNGSHLQSPPKLSAPNLCEYVLKRLDGVCQVRLDFNTFSIDDGTENGDLTGDCDTDTFIISGPSNTNGLGALCGDLTGQHMYLDFGKSDTITLDINTVMMLAQKWDIQVTYIKCNSAEQAPCGCLQYYTTPTGMVQSFNYANGHQKNNEMYSTCVKPLPGYNSITWTPCDGLNNFLISGSPAIIAPEDPPGLPNITSPGVGTAECPTDKVVIYGADTFCGNFLQGPITTTAKPFMLYTYFDEYEVADTPPDLNNTGYCMRYSQGH